MNKYRSMNRDLQQGINDGSYKSIAPGRGGVVELIEPMNRVNTLQLQYNITDYNKGLHSSGCPCSECA